MDIKSAKARSLKLPPLFHISFNDKLEGVWDPEFNQKPDENHPAEPEGDPFPYPEPNIGRISVAPTIKGCFVGVYPNVAKYFEEKNYPYMLFQIYTPVFKGNERIVTPEVLTKDRLVWDAVATHEYLILDHVQMNHWGTVEILNPNKYNTRYIHPFGDKSLPLESVGPADVDMTITEDLPVIKRNTRIITNSLGAFR
jgi:hypothetical protein